MRSVNRRREMAKLTYGERKNMPASTFAVPGKRAYPIPDASHARNALARASGKPIEAEVRSKVHAKFPGIGGRLARNLGRKG
jgi:hypothetical protein